MRFIDLTGKRFGRLTVIERAPSRTGHTRWKCRCDCGNTTIAGASDLKRGGHLSCGCLKTEATKKRLTKHGKSNTRLFRIWYDMKRRCYSYQRKYFNHYGGRGITVCDEWKNNFLSFYKWSMENGYKDNLSIDRIDNNGNYEPSNCRWVNRFTQMNNIRKNRRITYGAETHTITEWAIIKGVNRHMLAQRFTRGWDTERLLTQQPRKRKARIAEGNADGK